MEYGHRWIYFLIPPGICYVIFITGFLKNTTIYKILLLAWLWEEIWKHACRAEKKILLCASKDIFFASIPQHKGNRDWEAGILWVSLTGLGGDVYSLLFDALKMGEGCLRSLTNSRILPRFQTLLWYL